MLVVITVVLATELAMFMESAPVTIIGEWA
jgi:hypothetical protein